MNQTNVAVKSSADTYESPMSTQYLKSAPAPDAKSKQAPICFICSTSNSTQRHLLYNCTTYQQLTPFQRKEAITQAGHCINCLKHHLIKNCRLSSKCKHCPRTHSPKHTTSLHDLYITTGNVGAAVNTASQHKITVDNTSSSSHDATNGSHSPSNHASVKAVQLPQPCVFTRISAVRVLNPRSGASALV